MFADNGNVLCSQLNGLSNNVMETLENKNVHQIRCPRDIEMLRLIGQFLCDRGLNGAYAQLSKESGVSLEHGDATELRHAILEGRWNDAEAAVDRLAPMIGDGDSANEIRFLLLEQRFLEHLEANEVMPAVTLLRNRITPMQRNTERVHTLASCLMCRTITELRAQAGGWAGKDSGSRLQLINRIQAFVPAQTMLPPRRLEEIIEDSVRAQLAACIFHNPPIGGPTDFACISLLQRHSCGMQDFPAFCIQTVHQRDGELWLCQFSPDGCHLAVGGKDANVDVLQVDPIRHTVSRYRVLPTPSYVGCLCWSPDSRKLAACCGEEQSCVIVFDVATGQQLCNQKVHDEDTYSSATFFSDSRKLAFGGLKGIFYVMDTEDQGRILASVEGYRVQGMAAIVPPTSRVGVDVNLDGNRLHSSADHSAPGAPDSALGSGIPIDASLCPFPNPVIGQVDQLLIADSLHRIRLFRFGSLGPSPHAMGPTMPPAPPTESADPSTTPSSDSPPATASSAPAASVAATTVSTATSTTEEERSQSSNPTDLSVYLASSGAPGAPAGILFDMPILPVSLARLGPSSAQGLQQSQQSSLRPVLHHSGSTLGGTPYTVVSSSGGGNLGGGGSSLTILFGTPPDRSSSTYPAGPIHSTTATTSAEVRALTAAAAAAALAGSHSQSFAGLVHSLTSMVAATSSLETGGGIVGRALTTTADASSLGAAVVCTTSTSTTSIPGLSSTAHVIPGSSSVTSTTGFTPTADASSLGAAVVCTTSTSTTSIPGLSSTAHVIPGSSSVTSTTGFTPTAAAASGSNYGLLDHRTLFKETHAVQSITMSRSGHRALITIHKMGLHLWDVESCAIIQRFIGYKQDTFRLHSTFGGTNENFVATGSENGRIHIWHANGGNHPIHSACSSSNGSRDAVTCVHWNPVFPTMLASVNDAGEVCIWGPQRYTLGTGQPMEESS